VGLSGGSGKIVNLAQQHLEQGDSVKALLLVEAAMAAEPKNHAVLTMRLQILSVLRNASANLNETGWLTHGINQTQQNLELID
jgi:alkyl sulfatase BDS1-like metallo-beta-lactamase superfamily hydrolase